MTEPVRNSQGNFIRTPGQVDHDAHAAQLRGQGLSYRAIAAELGVSVSSAHQAVARAFRDTLTEPAEQARAVQRARLERAHEAAMAVLEAEHVAISDTNAAAIHELNLRAIDRVVKVSESLRRLDGLDQPVKVDATITEVTQQDVELREMVNEFRARNSTTEQQLRARREGPE